MAGDRPRFVCHHLAPVPTFQLVCHQTVLPIGIRHGEYAAVGVNVAQLHQSGVGTDQHVVDVTQKIFFRVAQNGNSSGQIVHNRPLFPRQSQRVQKMIIVFFFFGLFFLLLLQSIFNHVSVVIVNIRISIFLAATAVFIQI